jgi:hypothetical protein
MSEKREQDGKERKQPDYDAQTDLAFISVYVQVQTTWAVLILAFLAGLLALLATVQPRIGLTSIPVIILYQVLLGALWYSARRFFVATSVVKRAKDAFAQNHPVPLEWTSSFYERFAFKKDGSVKESVFVYFVILMSILFESVLFARIV